MKAKFRIGRNVRVVIILVGLTGLVAFADISVQDDLVRDIVVRLDNIEGNHFIDERDVVSIIEPVPGQIRNRPVAAVDFRDIENRLRTYRNFRKVELFRDVKGNLSEEGLVMATSDRYSSRVMVISGAYVTDALLAQDLNTSELGRKLLEMIRFIRNDTFLKAQVAELNVGKDGKVTIFPQVSQQTIRFGAPERLEDKFQKFRTLYKEILPRQGWNRYDSVNLEFEGQIVAK
jgi:cell division protein FtsQ